MKTEGRFSVMTAEEFPGWLKKQAVGRSVRLIQQHHTYVPAYRHFKPDNPNYFALLNSMRNAHLERGFSDIAQHSTTFPDGMIGTGRPLNTVPAGIKGANNNAVCIENLGCFDAGNDLMKPIQRDAILRLTASLCRAFGVAVDVDHIIYHHWYDLTTGRRTNGAGNTKTCPGTAFFGGNGVDDCNREFLPLIRAQLGLVEEIKPPKPAAELMTGRVTADSLNVRKGPSAKNGLLFSLACGTPVSCYEVKGSWWRVHPSKQQWLNSKYVEKTD